MPRLSLAMIVKNEAHTLGRALESVRGLCEEVVVVDTGSTDGTPDLAARLGATVSTFPWTGSFAEARHASLARCTGDWVLLLDADEAIEAADHGALRAALEGDWDAYRLIHRHYFRSGTFLGLEGPATRNETASPLGRAFPHYSDARSLRLFRNLPGLTFEGRMHALPDPWLERGGHRIGTLEVVVHHFGKTDLAREQAKARPYFEMAKADAAEQPGNSQFQYDLVQQALLAEEWEAALAAAEAHQRLRPRSPFVVIFGAGIALQKLGRHGEALAYFDRILATEAGHAAALAASAESLWRLGRLEEAQARFSEALTAEPGYSRTYLKLAELLEADGLWEDARLVLEAGLDQNPKDLALWEVLVGRGAARKDARVVRDAWNALQQVPDGGGGVWHQLVIHTLIGRNEIQSAREVVRRGLEAFPGHPDLLALQTRMGLGSGPHRILRA